MPLERPSGRPDRYGAGKSRLLTRPRWLDEPVAGGGSQPTAVGRTWRCTASCPGRPLPRGPHPARTDHARARHLTRLARCLGPRAPAPGTRLARAKNIGRSKVVPATTLTDLNDVRPELPIFGGHLGQFARLLDPPFIPAQLIPVDVRHVGELG